MHKNWLAFQTVWRFLGYRSTNKMPRKVRKAWLAFTFKVIG